MSSPTRKTRGPGRPRKTLPGGHRNRTPAPTENARLRSIARELGKKTKKKRSPEPADAAHRQETTTKTGKKILVLKRGHHQGRPPGASDKIPRGIKASVRSILEEVVSKNKVSIKDAVMQGITSGPQHADRYLRLAAEYVDGKPTDNVNLNARFNQDELGSARELLGKKMDAMLATILSSSESRK